MNAKLFALALLSFLLISRPGWSEETAGPSPIPKKLEALAKKTFAAKNLYFIWTDAPVMKAKDLKINYAVNPDLETTPAHTVIQLSYRGNQGRPVTWSGISDGIDANQLSVEKFKGIGAVSIRLIRSSDVIDDVKGVNPTPERSPPISNVVNLKVTFE